MTLKVNRTLWSFTLCALAAACSDDGSPTNSGPEGSGGLSKMRKAPGASSAADGLDPGAEGWDTEVLGAHAKEQLKELLHLGANPSEAAVGALATQDVLVSMLRSDTHSVIREGRDFQVHRFEPSTNKEAGIDALVRALSELFEPFEGEPEVHVKVWRVEPDPGGARTTLFYQAEGRANGRPMQQNATWECRLDPGGSLISELQTLRHEEVFGPEGSGTLFTEVTASVFAGNTQLADQLTASLGELSASSDITVGPQNADYEGLCIGDANGDGLDDVYLCQARGLPNRLLLQRPDGSIEEASTKAGLDLLDRTHSALFLDLDADGDQDLVVGGVDVLLFENEGNAPDAESGLRIPRFSRRAGFKFSDSSSLLAADVDMDGDLDLYICRYRATQESFPTPYHDAQNGLRNVLLRNEGDWSFSDATAELGLDENNARFSFAASFTDIDSDGDQDLYVANDFGRNNLYKNEAGHFTDKAASLGVEDLSAGMSADWGDPDSDGDYDLYVGNMFSAAGNRIAYQRKFQSEAGVETRDAYKRHARGNSLFRNQGPEGFLDVSQSAAVTMGRWSWCSSFVDLNNDCREDLVVANGYITTHGSTHDL